MRKGDFNVSNKMNTFSQISNAVSKFLFLVLILLLATKGNTQTFEQRKGEIEKMQTEIIRCLDEASTICSEGFKTELDVSTTDFEQIPYLQTARFCQCQGSYSLYSGEFSGHNWRLSVFFYFKDEQLFFARFQGGENNPLDEAKVYFDQQGRIIQVLNKAHDADFGLGFQMEEIMDADSLIQAQEEINEVLMEVREILSGR